MDMSTGEENDFEFDPTTTPLPEDTDDPDDPPQLLKPELHTKPTDIKRIIIGILLYGPPDELEQTIALASKIMEWAMIIPKPWADRDLLSNFTVDITTPEGRAR